MVPKIHPQLLWDHGPRLINNEVIDPGMERIFVEKKNLCSHPAYETHCAICLTSEEQALLREKRFPGLPYQPERSLYYVNK